MTRQTVRGKTISLRDLASARSGDKGNHANIGVVADSEAAFRFLEQELTADRVRAFFRPLSSNSTVKRFELPRVCALNFVLYDVLDGGASQSLRIDTQGKLLGTAILDLELPAPDNLDDILAAKGE